jgi:polyisoprenoid-binding protein YceI
MAGRRRWGRIVLVAVPVLVLLLVGGPFLYTRVIAPDPEPTLSLDARSVPPSAGSPSAGSTGSDPVHGTWTVGAGSRAGYRVDEVLVGQSVTAVGRTDRVTGTVTLSGSTVRAAEFSVDMASVTSDQSVRDDAFRERIMDVATHPTATFRLRRPIALGTVPAVGEQRIVTAAGSLTLRGTSRDVTVQLETRRSADGVTVAGSVPVRFADYGIPDPSVGPIRTEDNGVLEFRLELRRS